MNGERMTLLKWYGSSVKIPQLYSVEYHPFLCASMGLVRSVFRDRFGREVRIRFMENGTAYADPDRQEIVISRYFSAGDFGVRKLRSAAEIIPVIMGVVVHEAAHFAWSPKDLSPIQEHILHNTPYVPYAPLAANIGNIVEDIYIEAQVGREVPSLEWTLKEMNEVVLPEEEVEKVLSETAHIEDAPTTIVDALKAANLMLLAKVRDEVACEPYLLSLFELAREARRLHDFADRADLSLALYNRVMAAVKSLETKDSSQGQEAKEGLEKRSEGIASPHQTARQKRYVDSDSSASVDKLLNGDDEVNMLPAEVGAGVSEPTILAFETLAGMGTPVPMDERYVALAEMGRQRATVNRPYGQDMTRGTHLRKLHRIATDGRIFAEQVRMNNYQPMQVAILVDFSSSMRSALEAGEGSRLHKACYAAVGAAVGLSEARCEVAVYAHTADNVMRNDLDIYTVKRFNEPASVVAPRMGWCLNDFNVRLNQNRDGYAVRYVANKLRNKNRRRLLIVISDGAPQAHNYSGIDAHMHTARLVREVQKEGIKVVSISITSVASITNCGIYGKENDFYNEDPNVISEIIKSLVLA